MRTHGCRVSNKLLGAQEQLERDMVDNAFQRRTEVIRSAMARDTIVSDRLALDWLKQSQGAVTFLHVCTPACSL